MPCSDSFHSVLKFYLLHIITAILKHYFSINSTCSLRTNIILNLCVPYNYLTIQMTSSFSRKALLQTGGWYSVWYKSSLTVGDDKRSDTENKYNIPAFWVSYSETSMSSGQHLQVTLKHISLHYLRMRRKKMLLQAMIGECGTWGTCQKPLSYYCIVHWNIALVKNKVAWPNILPVPASCISHKWKKFQTESLL